MGIKMDLGSSDSQANSSSSASINRISAYQATLDALTGFVNDDNLTGAAYSNAKDYGRSLLIPLFQAGILFEEGKMSSVGQVPSRYRTDVGDESLDQDTLEEQIKAYDETIAVQNAALEIKRADKILDKLTIDRLEQDLEATTAIRNELQEKLNKLIAYDATSATLFSEMPAIESLLDQGKAQLSSGLANFNGSFELPAAEQLEWTQTVNTAWEKRNEVNNYKVALTKLAKGEELKQKDYEAIQAYSAKNPDDVKAQTIFEYIMGNKKSITNDVILDLITTSMEQLGAGIQRLGVAKILSGTKGPATMNALGQSTSFVMNSQAQNNAGQNLIFKGTRISNLGQYLGYGVMGIGLGVGIYNDITNENKTVGQAIVHNGISTGIGFGAGTTVATVVFGSNPAGWAVAGAFLLGTGVSLLASQGFEWTYENNVLGVRDGVDKLGSVLDEVGERALKGFITVPTLPMLH
ncbi:hypothetical protein [Streptococcus oricebi]|uniref:LXG domain-containing protein n=1 Tax=Streptococcus oricebi TaxID=1547447 RepID=A0ABS5B1A3_9STRE|nr:hypothetical protein [Streptococcus oricebi]MBP2622605.1 hypothetical protein [Streptococcus oricebi]